MGCGVDFDSDVGVNYVKVFFTKNGRQVGHSQKMKRPVHGLYPLFGKRGRDRERDVSYDIILCSFTLCSSQVCIARERR